MPRRLLPVCAVALALLGPAAPSVASDEAARSHTVFTFTDPDIAESSGLASSWVYRNLLWTVNDSGNASVVYGVDTDGDTVARIRLRERRSDQLRAVDFRDTESIAVAKGPGGDPWVYVGDTGGNLDGGRTSVSVYRFREPTRLGRRTLHARHFTLTYPDGRHDAEAILVTRSGRRIYVVPKTEDATWRYYTARLTGRSRVTLRAVDSGTGLVDDASMLPDGRVVLRSYSTARIFDHVGGKLQSTIELPKEEQGEAITYGRHGRWLLQSTEGRYSKVSAVRLEPPVEGRWGPHPMNAEGAPAMRPASDPDPPSPSPTVRLPHQAIVLLAVVGVGVASIVLALGTATRRRPLATSGRRRRGLLR